MQNLRILIVDNNQSLRDDFKKILNGYQLDFAHREDDAFNKAAEALVKGKSYALIFMEAGVPPRWNGITTIKKIWEKTPYTEVVICSAHSDYSFDNVIAQLGRSDRFLFLKKPFDYFEVAQMAISLTTKWNLNNFNRQYMEDLESVIKEKTSELETERARSVQSSKLAALGEMAAGIAHEINNPLAIIHSNIGFLKDLVNEKFDLATFNKIADKIETTAMRVAKIIKGLRAFARSGDDDPYESTPIEQPIQETLGICTEKFKMREISLTFEKPLTKIIVDCRQTQLIQVFLNLLNNAYDVVSSYPEKWVKIEIKEIGDNVEVWLTDSGKGIPLTIQEKLFRPFFTTKEVGKGTGLGLSVSKGIMQEHKGSLSIDNNCPNTRFIVRLPKTQSSKDD